MSFDTIDSVKLRDVEEIGNGIWRMLATEHWSNKLFWWWPFTTKSTHTYTTFTRSGILFYNKEGVLGSRYSRRYLEAAFSAWERKQVLDELLQEEEE